MDIQGRAAWLPSVGVISQVYSSLFWEKYNFPAVSVRRWESVEEGGHAGIDHKEAKGFQWRLLYAFVTNWTWKV